MPARSAASPGRIPFHLPELAGRGGAPYREVARVPLALDHLDPCASALTCQVEPGKVPVAGHLGRVEIQSGLQLVAPACPVQSLSEGDHLRNVVGCLAPDVRFDNPKPG